MTATIYIPTYRRLDLQRTWHRLSPKWRERSFLVCPMEEVEPLQRQGYQVLGTEAQGIAATRQWIMDQHSIDELGETVIMMDDDLRFCARRHDDPSKFLDLKGNFTEIDHMMEQFEEVLSYVALGSIAPRSGANRQTAPYVLNKRIFDTLGFNLRIAREEGIRIDRLPFMEDFDFALQFMRLGYPTLTLNTYCKEDLASNYRGGCSEYRDLISHASAALDLWSLHPDFVRITQRPGWQGDMEGSRTDVMILWQKAFQDGVEYRERVGRKQEPSFDWSTGDLVATYPDSM